MTIMAIAWVLLLALGFPMPMPSGWPPWPIFSRRT